MAIIWGLAGLRVGAPPAVCTAPPIAKGGWWWESSWNGSLGGQLCRNGPCHPASWGFHVTDRETVVSGRDRQSNPVACAAGPQPAAATPRSPTLQSPTRHPLSLVASWCAHIISPQPVGVVWILFFSVLVELLVPPPPGSFSTSTLSRLANLTPAASLRCMNTPVHMSPCRAQNRYTVDTTARNCRRPRTPTPGHRHSRALQPESTKYRPASGAVSSVHHLAETITNSPAD